MKLTFLIHVGRAVSKMPIDSSDVTHGRTKPSRYVRGRFNKTEGIRTWVTHFNHSCTAPIHLCLRNLTERMKFQSCPTGISTKMTTYAAHRSTTSQGIVGKSGNNACTIQMNVNCKTISISCSVCFAFDDPVQQQTQKLYWSSIPISVLFTSTWSK